MTEPKIDIGLILHEDIQLMAMTMKTMHSEYLKAGFTEEQTMKLLGSMMPGGTKQ